MQEKKEKRNTKSLLAESFKELLCKNDMEKITIKDITDKAGVIRPTFYNHFKDKYELLEYIIRKDLLLPTKPLFINELNREALTLLFSNIRNEKEFYKNAVRIEGQNSFESIARQEVAKLLLEIITERKGTGRHVNEWLSPRIIAEYYAQSMCYVAITWIKQDLKIAPKEVAEVYEYLVQNSMRQILEEFV